MTETLLLIAGASLLAVGVATLYVAVITLRVARRYVDLAEERLEALRENQERFLNRLEEQRSAERVAARERAEVEGDARTRQGAGQSIERAKRELLAVRNAPAKKGATDGPSAGAAGTGGPRKGDSPETPRKPKNPVVLPETRSKGPKKEEIEPPPRRRAVKRPHPDDDVKPGSTLAGQVRDAGGSPVEMFRVFYERYLDNYEGYVKLAEHIRQARTEEEKVPGSSAERDWKERLRRANDGIKRTSERLDILEHSNPGLASDDRVARRAAIARNHARFVS